MNVETTLALETPAQRITVEKSTISHPDPGLGLFASWTTAKGYVVGYYYGFLDFASLSEARQKKKNYGEGVIQMTAELIQKWNDELVEKIMDNDGIRHRL